LDAIFARSSPFRYNAGMDFQLVTRYTPRRDQPRAIEELMHGLAAGESRLQAIGSSSPGMGGLSGMRSR
jgi:hypothetical protein